VFVEVTGAERGVFGRVPNAVVTGEHDECALKTPRLVEYPPQISEPAILDGGDVSSMGRNFAALAFLRVARPRAMADLYMKRRKMPRADPSSLTQFHQIRQPFHRPAQRNTALGRCFQDEQYEVITSRLVPVGRGGAGFTDSRQITIMRD